jgi:hypothetical protein
MFLFLSMGLYPSDPLLLLMLNKRNMSIREVALRYNPMLKKRNMSMFWK